MSDTDPSFIASLFHSTLFAYQKTVRETLGRADIEMLNVIVELTGALNLDDSAMHDKSFTEVFNDVSKNIHSLGLAELRLEKVDENHYRFHVENCVWAKKIHKKLDTHDVTCPYALVVMALLQHFKGVKVFVANSEYLPESTITEIQAEN